MSIPNRSQSLDPDQTERYFMVVVHDVCTVQSRYIRQIVAALEPMIGTAIAAAVVPNWHGSRREEKDDYTDWVAQQFGEILLHGWTHSRDRNPGLVSLLTNRSDEFAGLSNDETHKRLELGRDVLTNVFGPCISGFVPPAWQRGCIRGETLDRHGLEYFIGYLSIDLVDGCHIPVSTITWDVGRFGFLGFAAETAGQFLSWCRSRSIPCLAIHPVDVCRGFLPRIQRKVELLVQSGRTAVVPRTLVGLTKK